MGFALQVLAVISTSRDSHTSRAPHHMFICLRFLQLMCPPISSPRGYPPVLSSRQQSTDFHRSLNPNPRNGSESSSFHHDSLLGLIKKKAAHRLVGYKRVRRRPSQLKEKLHLLDMPWAFPAQRCTLQTATWRMLTCSRPLHVPPTHLRPLEV